MWDRWPFNSRWLRWLKPSPRLIEDEDIVDWDIDGEREQKITQLRKERLAPKRSLDLTVSYLFDFGGDPAIPSGKAGAEWYIQAVSRQQEAIPHSRFNNPKAILAWLRIAAR